MAPVHGVLRGNTHRPSDRPKRPWATPVWRRGDRLTVADTTGVALAPAGRAPPDELGAKARDLVPATMIFIRVRYVEVHIHQIVDAAAPQAPDMRVRRGVTVKTNRPTTTIDLLYAALLAQYIEIPIYRGETDPRHGATHLGVDVVGRRMHAGFSELLKRGEDGGTLSRHTVNRLEWHQFLHTVGSTDNW